MRHIFPFLLLLALSFSISCRAEKNHDLDFSALSSGFNYTIPKPKQVTYSDIFCPLGKSVQFDLQEDFGQRYASIISSVHQTMQVFGNTKGDTLAISLARGFEKPTGQDSLPAGMNNRGAYILSISCNTINVNANDDEGFINGLTTLESLVATHKGRIPVGQIIDYPSTKVRALHLSLWPSSLINLKVAVKLARFGHYNTLIILNHRGVGLHSLKHLSDTNSLSIMEFRDAINYAKENGLELIPELKLLSHQDKFLAKKYPEFLFNKLTYDPRKGDLYTQVVFPAIEEIIELTGATKFHIGHDEVAGWNEWFFKNNKLNKGEKQLPPDLFLQDILTLHRFLTNKNIEIWMWGDMLVTKDEFPVMKNAGANLNGFNGYDQLRSKIPKDIVINAWHYRGNQTEFPTALAFAKLGHKVLGATWENITTTRNFTRYIKDMPLNNEGMIATTWYGLSGKKNQVHEIIINSAEIFWNAP